MTTIGATRHWIVVYADQSSASAMQIIDVTPAPEHPDVHTSPYTDRLGNHLPSYTVKATGPAEARRMARQLHDVERIRHARARQHACRARRRVPAAAPLGFEAVEVASDDLGMTHRCRAYANAMASAALRAGYQHRSWPQEDLTFEQYLARLPLTTLAVLHRYAALAATGRNSEAVALLVNTLAATASDL
ncbi:hypothetical protein [Streptomyces sp. NPDC059378]|uniref:hypothetical protein n=1 Tax=Streptomyces sp. NPDC059378 TaxID=3346815 RepID=UPI0036750641